MSKEDGSEIRFAVVTDTDIFPTEEGVEILSEVVATDEEIMQAVIEDLRGNADELCVLTPDQARMERNKFCFSSSCWKAPWQPKGPTPPWRNDNGPVQ